MKKHIAVAALTLLMVFTIKGYAQNQGKVVHLTSAEFKQKVFNWEKNPDTWKYEGKLPCIVDFYADWCRPCKLVAPIMDELAEKIGMDKVEFLTRNCVQGGDILATGMKMHPTGLKECIEKVAEAIDFLEYYARQALKYKYPSVEVVPYPGEDNESFYIPLGAGVVIAPWNFPIAIFTGMLAGPVAVGNTVVAKPAEDTVIIAAKVFEILHEAGFPPGVVNFLPGKGSEVGAYLVEHPRTRFINFTGSLEVGLWINQAAAKLAPGQRWIKRVFLELGGKDAIIVDETADFDAATEGILISAYGFQGQKCSAASRLIVTEKAFEPLMERVLKRAERLVVGPAEENPDLGPVASKAQEKKILSYIEIGKGEGQLVLGGERLEGEGYFIAPTIFTEVSPTAKIAQEEIFGPVLSVIRVKDFGEALEVANNTVYGLTGGVYSRKREHLERARREFHVGNLYFNRKITGALVGVQPFGGFNLSGTDTKAGGPDYLLHFLQMKTVAERF